jgi:hypothetical protein
VLRLKVLNELFAYWAQLIQIHSLLTQSSYLKPIIAYLAQSILEEEYLLISLVSHLLYA